MHETHGQESADDYPNASYCPCVAVAPIETQEACAAAGCRYCSNTQAEDVKRPKRPKRRTAQS